MSFKLFTSIIVLCNALFAQYFDDSYLFYKSNF